ncbi:MAG: hypothetical protein BMS9Abin10_0830 [Gammaproteobacteria bacterium]|nr:MAG: hypothetical protein BMS9Abin10_0830 [Gammaproteobacteria bacterium]
MPCSRIWYSKKHGATYIEKPAAIVDNRLNSPRTSAELDKLRGISRTIGVVREHDLSFLTECR